MATNETQRYSINGLIDTKQPVLDNLTNIANSCGSWLTYSNELGKWGVVINRLETPVFNFNDSNILGTIEVTGVGLGSLYNNVRVEFPRRDIRGETDWVNIEIPEVDRHPNEIDNTLELKYDLVTDPIQAELLGFIELKQSRLNRTIKFATDWSSIGIVAGDVITVTNASYGFNQEKFRIISVTETTDDSGAITLDILAMGYSDSVYDEDFTLYERTTEDGIVTLGSIGTPAQPQLTKFERDANPRILVEAVVPTGVVEKMEFWYSTDDVNYTIIATMLPTNGGVFSTGDEVEYSYSTNTGGNVYVKVRAVNNQTVSAFSPVGSLVYAPVQVTDAIGPGTDVVDGAGDSLLGLLGANALMALLSGLMDNNDSGTGSIWEKVFDIFNNETGTDITDPAVVGVLNNAANIMVSENFGYVTVSDLAPTPVQATMYTGPSFVATKAATYKIDVIIDQNTSGANGGRGPAYSEPSDNVSVYAILYNVTTSSIAAEMGSGGIGAFFWTDFAMTKTAILTPGHTYEMIFNYIADTDSNPTNTASFDIGWNVYSLEDIPPP